MSSCRPVPILSIRLLKPSGYARYELPPGMRMNGFTSATLALFTVAAAVTGSSGAAAQDDPKATEQWEPVPRVVTAGAKENAPPSDAIILFDGRDLAGWEASADHSPARWKVHDGVLTVDKTAGNIQTRQRFRSYQLHLEWQIP